MTAGITVNDFVHEPGKNDAEYIALLEEALQRQKEITNKAIAKIKQSKPCEDAVSRKAVAGIYTALWEEIGTIMDRDEWDDVCKNTANELPSVTPARKVGEWVEDEEQLHVEKMYHCSKCGFKALGTFEKTDFCGGCGAMMKSGVNKNDRQRHA